MYWLEELFLSPYVYYYDKKIKKILFRDNNK